MKFLLIFSAAIVATQALSDAESWEKYKVNFSKSYKNIVEEKRRFNIFLSNLETIRKHNEKFENGQSTFKMGINHFSDLTSDEFMERIKSSSQSKPTISAEKEAEFDLEDDIPDTVDWSSKGAVTEIKQQGQYNSSWAFSATGSVESHNFIKTGKLLSLSEQQLVDCCSGCDGNVEKALDYIIANGIMLEKDYPYKGQGGECKYSESDVAVRVKSYNSIKSGDESDLQKAVATYGPVSASISITSDFQHYHSGIMMDLDCKNTLEDLNHEVLVVGYGKMVNWVLELDYWIVKNSWGTEWGASGYVWMTRNRLNQCGIATNAVYPEVEVK